MLLLHEIHVRIFHDLIMVNKYECSLKLLTITSKSLTHGIQLFLFIVQTVRPGDKNAVYLHAVYIRVPL